MTHHSDSDLAWLAGIIDGEGCFSVKRHRGARGTSHQLWLVLCNTSESMVLRAAAILQNIGVHHDAIRKVWKGKKATRWQYWLLVARKQDLLRVTEALLPHLTAKKAEARVAIWYLRKACAVRMYRATDFDKLVLDSMSLIKRNGGEAPAELTELLREVIPSEATEGAAKAAGSVERVETTSAPPKGLTHERPAPLN